MAEMVSRKYCGACEKEVKAVCHLTRNGTRFAATLLTLGIRLPMWLLMLVFRTWRCDECGGKISRLRS